MPTPDGATERIEPDDPLFVVVYGGADADHVAVAKDIIDPAAWGPEFILPLRRAWIGR